MILTKIPLDLTSDHVWIGQGIDPAHIQNRRPDLVRVANHALEIGRPLISPALVYAAFRVQLFTHEKLTLEGGLSLTGALVARHLGQAEQVLIVLATIGDRLEQAARTYLPSDPALGMALDGLGNAALECLTAFVCNWISAQYGGTSLPINPGLVGWDLLTGQQQIFSALSPGETGIQLLPSGQMLPLKSTSLVLGVGEHVFKEGERCDYCSAQLTCQYQPKIY